VLRVGEWVRIGGVEEAVTSVGAFSTRIRTSTDEEVTISRSSVPASTPARCWTARSLRLAIQRSRVQVPSSPDDQRAADSFATVATSLARRGATVGTLDTLIAARALSLPLMLVTNNTRHFSRVVGLKTSVVLFAPKTGPSLTDPPATVRRSPSVAARGRHAHPLPKLDRRPHRTGQLLRLHLPTQLPIARDQHVGLARGRGC